MLAGMILGAAIVIAVLMFFGTGGSLLQRDRQALTYSLLGLGLAGAVAVVVFMQARSQPDASGQVFRSGMSTVQVAQAAAQLRSPGSTATPSAMAGAQSSVASIPSLIEGLKSRLDAEPGNASGWALLAQSYAFTGDTAQAEIALQRAVALGMDEADLRQRVDSARRDPHNGIAMSVN
jgi:hypothetical protein